MTYLKMLGVLVGAVAALVAFTGTASATITSGGKAYTGEISATSTNSSLDGTIDVKCSHSTVGGSTSNGATTFVIASLSFTGCGSDTVTPIVHTTVVLKNPTIHDTNYGFLRIDSNGTIYSEFTLVTVQVHRTVFGFPVTTHCLYETDFLTGTDLGTLTEGTTAVKLIGTNIPQKPTDGGCGANAQWTGDYTIKNPGPLTID